MPNDTRKSRLKKKSVLKAIAWLPAMVAWPVLIGVIEGWTRRYGIDTDSLYYLVFFRHAKWLNLIGWIIITYLCIGKKSAVALVVLSVVVYVSPLGMSSFRDCGSIPDWKCRWTCKSAEELIELGIGHRYISNAFWQDNPDVVKAGGFCGY